MSMPTKRVDYNKFKLDFFADEEQSFGAWFRKTQGKKPTGLMSTKAKGWANEKQEWLKGVTELALQRAQIQTSKTIEIPKEKLQQMKKTGLELLIKRLNDFMPKKDKDGKVIDDGGMVNVKDIKDIINLVKVELGEPTSISKDDTQREPDQVTIVINSPTPINRTGKRK